MNALIDTNVIVDVLTGRAPFFGDSSRVLDHAERGDYVAWVCATTVTTVFYLTRRHLGAEATVERIKDLTSICTVAPVNKAVIDSALESSFADFEDAVLHYSALIAGADCIVTRNEGDFRESSLLIYSPAQFLAALSQKMSESGVGKRLLD
ncbi:PIN domain-containing protein [Phragmitibacter flavus]|uniref:PIN domain-containing protein n=1 Tax=Phragmitibacter flavus TaxID=2576071 RepID=A0A5R8KBA5_9BACT|nr:PIN domain-containing protein [Phragmitibacter flavus]TLD69598.1 PIN domain-containing protein [Phragmitibacter flavus]